MRYIKKYGIYLLLLAAMFLSIPVSNYFVLNVYQSEGQRKIEKTEPVQADEVRVAQFFSIERGVPSKSIRRLFRFSGGIQDYDFPEGTVDLVFTPFQPRTKGLAYTIRNVGRTFNIEFYTGKMRDGIYSVDGYLHESSGKIIEYVFNIYMEVENGVMEKYQGREINRDLSAAIQDEKAFASFSAAFTNKWFVMYSVAGLDEESADVQTVYYRIEDTEGKQMIFEPVQQVRDDYAEMRGSNLYLRSGSRVYLGKKDLPDGVYKVKLFIEKDRLYEAPGSWSMEISDGSVTVESSEYWGNEIKYDLSNAVKKDAAFGSISANYNDSGKRLILYSVAGINEESADSQQVYYQLTSQDGIRHIYAPVQQDRPDYAEMRGSDLYLKSGNKIELAADTLNDGQYEVKIFVQKEQLYEVPQIWTMELLDGSVTLK